MNINDCLALLYTPNLRYVEYPYLHFEDSTLYNLGDIPYQVMSTDLHYWSLDTSIQLLNTYIDVCISGLLTDLSDSDLYRLRDTDKTAYIKAVKDRDNSLLSRVMSNGVMDSDNKLIIGNDSVALFTAFLRQWLQFNHADRMYKRSISKAKVITYTVKDHTCSYMAPVDGVYNPHILYLPDIDLDYLVESYGNFILSIEYAPLYPSRFSDKHIKLTDKFSYGKRTTLTTDKGNVVPTVKGFSSANLPSDINYGMKQGVSCLPTLLGKFINKVKLVTLTNQIKSAIERQNTKYVDYIPSKVLLSNKFKTDNLINDDKPVKWVPNAYDYDHKFTYQFDGQTKASTVRVDKSKLAFKGKQKTKSKISWGSSPAKLTSTEWLSRQFNTQVNNGLNAYHFEYIKDTVFYVSRNTSFPAIRLFNDSFDTSVYVLRFSICNEFDLDILQNALSFIGKPKTVKDPTFYEQVEARELVRLGMRSEASLNVQAPEVKRAVANPTVNYQDHLKEESEIEKAKALELHKARSLAGRLAKNKVNRVTVIGNVLKK
jgi:hypothetical protein